MNHEGISIPDNLYIIGTMNSADRSIALIDYAIRRRFIFIEIEPNYLIIDKMSSLNGEIILGDFLKKINGNIVDALEDKDLRLGHSIFIQKEFTKYTNEEIYDIIHFKIIPTLREYTYGHNEKFNEILPESITRSSSTNLLDAIKEFVK